MSKIQDIITRAQQIEGSIQLDDVVHDIKNSEASDINNQGAKAQIEYIVEALGEDEGIRRIEAALDE